MGKRKKNRDLAARRKRMRRPAHLIAAVTWRAGYGGKNIAALTRREAFAKDA